MTSSRLRIHIERQVGEEGGRGGGGGGGGRISRNVGVFIGARN